ncbi:hypothetical protein ACTQ5K_08840 [Niallia sp. Sow4_A1]|uniref:hypothetical protein n=1 Tax=unclassified Niallia TaxID=2837522 RepID=UPI00203B4027|nr:hypothetical protein [Niallia sp. MER TA 168]MCM3364237.1 hypothetical protein [Niallia sp. MER TA 168]
MQLQLKDIIRFKKELYFNGAVQVDWFYNYEKQEEVSKSFVFHGPEYFGVGEDDITFKSHRLVDTASFTNILANKLYGDSTDSNFFMTIAPYGTGKSHLAVTIASLFSREDKLQKIILNNITKVDKNVASELNSHSLKPNIVLVLNGMKDFNLNYEVLNATQKVLKLHNVNDDFLKTLTKSYDIAKNFVNNTFDNYDDLYNKYANELFNDKKYEDLKTYLIENIIQDADAFEVINTVYYHINGIYIRWDEGVSAGDVLTKIAETLCGDRGKFNKVIVLFDEFGRYIEFASSYPTRAGDSALQQIYESIQDSGDKIVFVGFIQSDLKSYLTRVDRTANINRYIGRYEASEKIHLSSNLETIFANLIERKDSSNFKNLVADKFEKQNKEWKQFHEDFIEWQPQATTSSVWGSYIHFKKVVLEGIFPLHPLTSWMLSNLSSWLQQRSSLTFLERQIEQYGNTFINEFGDLPLIPATRIIRSEFFKELLAAEQEGRKQSEYCILYNQILTKYGDKFDERHKEVLAANLIVRIGRLKTKSIEETKQALKYSTYLSEAEIDKVVSELEHEFGVLSYDDSANVFDFIADATGINDFKRLLSSKRRKLDINIGLVLDSISNDILPLDTMETSFGRKNQISTREWQFEQQIVHINDVNKSFLLNLKNDFEYSTAPDKPKGKLVWLYIPSLVESEKLSSISSLLERFEFDKMPIGFFALDDQENKFSEALTDYQISNLFTEQEKVKYSKFIPDFKYKAKGIVKDRFNELVSKRIILTKTGLEKASKRPKLYFDALFDELYHAVIPFPFTEFSNKSLGKAKKNLSRIGRLILSGAAFQLIHSETTEIKNRIETVLFEGRMGSWGIFNNDYQFVSPTNLKVRKIYEDIDKLIEENDRLAIDKVFEKYQKPPYGINDFALALLIATYLTQRKIEIRVDIEGQRLRLEEWGNKVFQDKKVDFSSLFETTITKVDPDKLAGRYINLYNKVERNNDIDKCPQLSNEFEQLKLEEDIPEELEDKVINLELMLREGLKLYDKNTRVFGELRSKLSVGSKELDFKKIFEVLDGCSEIDGSVQDSTRYVYNSAHVEEANNMTERCYHIIEKEFEGWLSSLKCISYAQVSGFEKWVNHLIASFTRYGYKEEGRKLRTKLQDILDNLNIVRQLENINETVENFLKNNKPNNSSGYDELVNMKNSGQEILELLNNDRADKKYMVEFFDKVESRINLIEKMLENLAQEISDIYDSMFELTNVGECREFLSKAKNILSKSINDVDREGIEEAANDIQNFLNEVTNLNNYKDNRKNLYTEIEILKDKWSNFESDIDFSPILETLKDNYIYKIDQIEEKWVNNNIKIHSKIDNWDASDCSTWLEQTRIIPTFLSESTKEDLKNVKQLVNQRLNELSVDAVISLFENLSDEQKLYCYEKLTAKVIVQN